MHKVYRDAETGEYVTKTYAEMCPHTTVSETVLDPGDDGYADPSTPKEGES